MEYFSLWSVFRLSHDKVYDVLDIKDFVRSGKRPMYNVYYQGKAVQVFKRRQDCGMSWMKGISILLVVNRFTVVICHRNGPVPKITVQLSFTYEYDARRKMIGAV